ncbi:LysM peptidoglycan-binding domain-containing protein [Ruegeria arenilitoris]|uniref:LysM peptidoglycan-binding domain-containing protein n=1 Tax=Ruegeria arenilitoris TaxID=1173585 RepID=UPI00147AF231|nr:tail protein X [Ruegeria arenilitoris]
MSDYLEHTTQPGERWDLIAHRYYGDAMLMHHILQANPDLVGDPSSPVPLILDPGMKLRIPVLEQAQLSAVQLPPWKRTTS